VASVEVDISQVKHLAADIRAGYREAASDAMRVVGKGALQIKKDWQREWSSLLALPGLPRTINYDVRLKGAFAVEGEIGPDRAKGGQSPLAVFAEYGSVNNAPHPGGAPALAREAPKFEAQAALLIENLLK
jgi:hypothetical protein